MASYVAEEDKIGKKKGKLKLVLKTERNKNKRGGFPSDIIKIKFSYCPKNLNNITLSMYHDATLCIRLLSKGPPPEITRWK